MTAHARRLRPGQVRRHAHRGRGGRRDGRGLGPARRPATSSCRCRCRTAAPGSSTCCTRRSVATCTPSTVTDPYGEPDPRRGAAWRRDGVRRERPGRRAAPAPSPRTATRSARTTRGVGELLGAAVDAARAGSSSGSAAPPPTTAAPGCSPRSGPRPTAARSTQGPAGLAELTCGRPGARPRAVRRASSWCWPPTSTTRCSGIHGATKIYGPQKGLPEERLRHGRRLAAALRRARPTARSPRRRAPVPPAGSGSRCCCSAADAGAGRRGGRRGGRAGRPAAGGRPRR